MVSKGGIQHLGSYLASFDDVIGDQDEEDETFMHHPLNVYNLIRHVAVGWPIVTQVFDVSKSCVRRHKSGQTKIKHLACAQRIILKFLSPYSKKRLVSKKVKRSLNECGM